jgi:hypothetical protein
MEGQVDTGRITHIPQMHRNFMWKSPVRVATTAAGTLATSFENGDTIDGVVVATNDRILVKNQAAGAENGIRVVQASGTPFRTYDMDDFDEVSGSVVYVQEGTANGGKMFVCTTADPIDLDTTALVFTEFGGGSFQPLDADLTAIAGLTRTRGDLIRGGAANWEDFALGVDGRLLASDGTDAVWEAQYADVIAIVGGGGSVITTGGPKGFLKLDFPGVIEAWDLEGDVSTTSVMDIKKRATGGGAATSITASAKPTITAATEATSSTLTGWTTTISAGDKLYWHVDTNNNATILSLALKVRKT